MNKKEFDKKVRDFVDITVFGTGETIFSDMIIFSRETWECIEQYGEEQRIVGKENALFSLLELPSIIDVPHIVHIIENRIKELKDE
ncbi:hypothetical protein LCGC14_2912870 [marine sediment metagenome]|uniref:Uncharacterized protein n=1 Tax=marine sediment metagenome TaxID=412755 RepID=A0A0F8ZYS2_9ZZZZ